MGSSHSHEAKPLKYIPYSDIKLVIRGDPATGKSQLYRLIQSQTFSPDYVPTPQLQSAIVYFYADPNIIPHDSTLIHPSDSFPSSERSSANTLRSTSPPRETPHRHSTPPQTLSLPPVPPARITVWDIPQKGTPQAPQPIRLFTRNTGPTLKPIANQPPVADATTLDHGGLRGADVVVVTFHARDALCPPSSQCPSCHASGTPDPGPTLTTAIHIIQSAMTLHTASEGPNDDAHTPLPAVPRPALLVLVGTHIDTVATAGGPGACPNALRHAIQSFGTLPSPPVDHSPDKDPDLHIQAAQPVPGVHIVGTFADLRTGWGLPILRGLLAAAAASAGSRTLSALALRLASTSTHLVSAAARGASIAAPTQYLEDAARARAELLARTPWACVGADTHLPRITGLPPIQLGTSPASHAPSEEQPPSPDPPHPSSRRPSLDFGTPAAQAAALAAPYPHTPPASSPPTPPPKSRTEIVSRIRRFFQRNPRPPEPDPSALLRARPLGLPTSIEDAAAPSHSTDTTPTPPPPPPQTVPPIPHRHTHMSGSCSDTDSSSRARAALDAWLGSESDSASDSVPSPAPPPSPGFASAPAACQPAPSPNHRYSSSSHTSTPTPFSSHSSHPQPPAPYPDEFRFSLAESDLALGLDASFSRRHSSSPTSSDTDHPATPLAPPTGGPPSQPSTPSSSPCPPTQPSPDASTPPPTVDRTDTPDPPSVSHHDPGPAPCGPAVVVVNRSRSYSSSSSSGKSNSLQYRNVGIGVLGSSPLGSSPPGPQQSQNEIPEAIRAALAQAEASLLANNDQVGSTTKRKKQKKEKNQSRKKCKKQTRSPLSSDNEWNDQLPPNDYREDYLTYNDDW